MWKLVAFAVLIAAGQLMFKRTAQALGNVSGFEAILRQVVLDPWFIAALAMYMTATVLWVLALREVPLSRAYPFMALAFVLVPAGAVFFYGEALGSRYFIGLALILAGIAVIGSSNSTQAAPPVRSAR